MRFSLLQEISHHLFKKKMLNIKRTIFFLVSFISSLCASQEELIDYFDIIPHESKFLIFDEIDIDDLAIFAQTSTENKECIYRYCQSFFLPEYTYENIKSTFLKERGLYNTLCVEEIFWRFYDTYLSKYQIYTTVLTLRHEYGDNVFGFFSSLWTFDTLLEDSILAYRECVMRIAEHIKNPTLMFSYCGYELYFIPPESFFITHIEILLFHNNNLSIIPHQINVFTSLKQLSLYNNKLKVLPEKIGELSNLENLNVSNNQLTTLPDTFGNLKKLTSFYVTDNKINSLPASFGNLNSLSLLCMYKNPINNLPISFPQLENLKILMIDGHLQSLPCIQFLEEKHGLVVNNLPIFMKKK